MTRGGGKENPGEMLMRFLFRYSGIAMEKDKEIYVSTAITQETLLRSDGGETDFPRVLQIQNCIELFKTCYLWLLMQMTERIKGKGRGSSEESILGSIVNCTKVLRYKENRDNSISLL